jgi:hypothetical protein
MRAAHGKRLLLAAMLCALASGCVTRRMTIRSNPPGAYVYVDNYPVGTTPCSTNFIYYGQRQIRLVKDGYETLTVEQPIPAPWYQWFGIDFVTENLIPGEIRDERTLDYQLQPQRIVPREEVLANAEALRRGSLGGAAIPVGATMPAAPGTAPETIPPGGISVGGGAAPNTLPPPNALPATRLPPPPTNLPTPAPAPQ